MTWKRLLVILAVIIWGSVTCLLALAYYHTDQINSELRTQIQLLHEIRTAEAEQCNGIYRVNAVCEKVVAGFATQLGLEVVSPSQILTTGIVERHKVAEGGMGGE